MNDQPRYAELHTGPTVADSAVAGTSTRTGTTSSRPTWPGLPEPYYADEWVTIYHGDCQAMLPPMGDQSVNLVATDPPYNVDLGTSGPARGRGYASHIDTMDNYEDWLLPVFEQMRRVGRLVMLTPGVRNVWMYPPATWALCWAKPGSTRRSDLGGFNEWEPVLVYGKRRIYNDLRYLPTAPNLARGESGDHPCPKPLSLMRWLVNQGCDEGGTVLDPFMGSGSTLRAAKDAGRRAIGFEIEERYCEIAARRMSQGVLDFGEAP